MFIYIYFSSEVRILKSFYDNYELMVEQETKKEKSIEQKQIQSLQDEVTSLVRYFFYYLKILIFFNLFPYLLFPFFYKSEHF